MLFQFLGSEESILEYQPDPPEGVTATPATAPESGGSAPAPSRALADLIHSRDFVIDFPRVFVLDSGSVVGARDVLFPERLPERSQSSLSLRQARDWMCLMSNKLEEQQGLRRLRKDEMQQVYTEEFHLPSCHSMYSYTIFRNSNSSLPATQRATAGRVRRMDAIQPVALVAASARQLLQDSRNRSSSPSRSFSRMQTKCVAPAPLRRSSS